MCWNQPLINYAENNHCPQSKQATVGYKHLACVCIFCSFLENIFVYTLSWFSTSKLNIIITRGEGSLQPPSPLVLVAGATLISREVGVSSEFIELSVYNFYVYIKSKLIVNVIL